MQYEYRTSEQQAAEARYHQECAEAAARQRAEANQPGDFRVVEHEDRYHLDLGPVGDRATALGALLVALHAGHTLRRESRVLYYNAAADSPDVEIAWEIYGDLRARADS